MSNPTTKTVETTARTHAEVRADFPLLQQKMNGKPLVFLDSAASSQKPRRVIEAIERYYEEQHANVHRGVYSLSQEATEAYELARRRLQQFINAEHDHEVIFVRGTTEGINLVAHGFERAVLKPGDEVLISGMEHHSNIVPWQMACDYSGAKLRVIPVLDNGELDMTAYRELLGERTKIVAVNHVSNSLGTVNPVREIIRQAHERGVPVLIDGAQAVPHLRVDVRDLDADFYTFSGHKMLGPTGIGILYGKESWLNRLPPYQGGGDMIETVTFEETTYNELPFKFEAGTPDISGAVGLGEAAEYMRELGPEFIEATERDLLEYATEQIETVEGIRLVGTAEHKASVLSFLVEGTHPYDVGAILDKLGVAVRTGHHCTQPLMQRFDIPGTVRASFAVYNNREDVDRFIAALRRAVGMLR